jgi:hypothetical protein
MSDFTLIYAQYIFGMIPYYVMPSIASEAIDNAYYSESIDKLASFINPTKEEVDSIVFQAFEDMQVPKMSQDEAAVYLSLYLCKKILNHTYDPQMAAIEIEKIVDHLKDESLLKKELEQFVNIKDEYEKFIDNEKIYKDDPKWGGDYYKDLQKKELEKIVELAEVFVKKYDREIE